LASESRDRLIKDEDWSASDMRLWRKAGTAGLEAEIRYAPMADT
jgi:hypothetical protein